MYLLINGNRHTVSRRIVKSNEIHYLSVTPAPEEVSGIIQMFEGSAKLPDVEPEAELIEEIETTEVTETTDTSEENENNEATEVEGENPETPEIPEDGGIEVPENGVVQEQPKGDFLISEDNADNFLRWTYSGTLLVLTNIPEPAPVEPDSEEIREQTERAVREQRNALIAETDWTQVLDAPITAECREAFRIYRQALRDIPQQENFPYDIIWPEKPEVVKADPDPVDTALEILVGGEE